MTTPAIRQVPLEELNAHSMNTLTAHLGIVFTGIGVHFLEATMPVDERTRQPFGLLHGGASVVLAETLGSVAANLCAPSPDVQYVGLEINANHIRSVISGQVKGRATPIHVGRSTQVWDIRIHTEEGKLVCVSRLTMAAVKPG